MTGGGALGVEEEEGGSRGLRLFITNVTSRWDLAMAHPGRYLFPQWKQPEVEDGKHGQLEHKLKCPPMGSFWAFQKGDNARGERCIDNLIKSRRISPPYDESQE